MVASNLILIPGEMHGSTVDYWNFEITDWKSAKTKQNVLKTQH